MTYVLMVFLYFGPTANIQFQEFSSYEQCMYVREYIKKTQIKHRSVDYAGAQCFKK